jgi:hypothetical protein
MRETLSLIEERAQRFEAHRFFQRLAGTEPNLHRAAAFAPAGTFWVMTFQDILRLNADLARDVEVRQILAQHCAEDSGHEQWFLEDLQTLFGEEPTSIRWLFSNENRKVREVSFALMAEVFRVQDDRLRLVLVEVLEAVGRRFFGNISRFLQRSGHASRLKYLSRFHLDTEESHEMHGEAQRGHLEKMTFPPELRAPAEQLVDRMFASFQRLYDTLAERMEAAA